VHDPFELRDRSVFEPGPTALVEDLGFDVAHHHNRGAQIDGVGDAPRAVLATTQGTERHGIRAHQGDISLSLRQWAEILEDSGLVINHAKDWSQTKRLIMSEVE
jgi:hypothetical protein